MNLLKNFVRDEQGQDMIEYALLLGFIVLAGAVALNTINPNLAIIWNATDAEVGLAATAAS